MKRMVRSGSHCWAQFISAVMLFGLFVQRAMAQLPAQADPDSGTVRAGNIIDAVKFYAKDIFIVAGLIIATVVFIIVTTNAISVYKEIRDGRRTWGDLGMHAGAGAVLIVFVVFLLTQAQNIIV